MYGGENNNGCGTRTYMDIDTGDITVVHDYPGSCNGSIFHIKNKK